MNLATILFIIVMLHLVAGFGYVFYKLEFSGKKKKSKDVDNEQDNAGE